MVKCTNIYKYIEKARPNNNRERDALDMCVRIILN